VSVIDDSQALAAAEAHKQHEAIVYTIGRMRSAWAILAEQLHTFMSNEAWKALGYATLESWLAQPEISIERRHAFLLRQAWDELVVRKGVDPAELRKVDVSKVQAVLPAVRRGQVNVDDALADCETLARDDLREKYSGANGGPDGPLNAAETPEYATCPSCGSKYKVAHR
jgi:hypothetical protein